MDFVKLVESVIFEDMTAGGEGSVFGQSVNSTATPFSGDNYAAGDARKPYSMFGGVLTRRGLNGKRKKKKKNKKKAK